MAEKRRWQGGLARIENVRSPLVCACLGALLLLPTTAAAQLLDSGARGLPALAAIDLGYAPQRIFVLAASGGYGFIEDQDGASGTHHRGLWHAGVGFSPASWFSGSVIGDGRVRPGPNGGASVIGLTPELSLRVHPHFHDDLLIGFATRIAAPPGLDAVTGDPAALRGEIKALLGGRASKRVIIAGELGFRLDNTDAQVDDPTTLDGDERLAAALDEFNGLLVGIGFGYRMGNTTLFADVTGDLPMSTGSDQIGQAPLRLSAELRQAMGDSVGLHIRAGTELNGRVPLDADAPLIGARPRLQLEVGLTVGFGGKVERPAVGGVTAAGEPVAGAAPEPAPAPIAAPAPEPQVEEPPAPAAAPAGEPMGQIRGQVRSFRGKPLKASAVVYPLGTKVDSDEDGTFSLPVPPGKYTVRLRAYGYRSQNREIVITEGSVTLLNVELRKK